MKKLVTNERLIIIVLLLLLIGGISYHFNTVKKTKDKFEAELKLKEALQDSVETYKNERDELVANKRTLQGEIKDLGNDKIKLNDDQKELLSRLKSEKRKNNIIVAALIKSEIMIDSLNNLIGIASDIDTTNNTVSFVELDTTKHFNYDLTVRGVKPVEFLRTPTLSFNKVYFPNTQFITFQFDENKRKDFPISFSVSNSNNYMKVVNIESFAIPGLQKEVVNPSGWQKLWKFVKVNGKYILVGAAGFGIGYVASQ